MPSYRSKRGRQVSLSRCQILVADFSLNNFLSNCLIRSTILRILSGRHLVKPDGAVMVLGRSAFHDTRLNFERSYLDTDWGMRTVAFAGYGCPLQADIPVFGMMQKLQEEYPVRRDELLQLLGVDLKWRMHQVSDGQRRRVQVSNIYNITFSKNNSPNNVHFQPSDFLGTHQAIQNSPVRRSHCFIGCCCETRPLAIPQT